MQKKQTFTCTRKLYFDSAHRVVGHKGKCSKLHGHRYAAEVTFVIDELSEIGMVVDFGFVKEKLGDWIEENLDHNTILHKSDKKLGEMISSYTNQKIYYMDKNPTAENIADHILVDICPNLFSHTPAKCIKVRLYETPNCYADSSF